MLIPRRPRPAVPYWRRERGQARPTLLITARRLVIVNLRLLTVLFPVLGSQTNVVTRTSDAHLHILSDLDFKIALRIFRFGLPSLKLFKSLDEIYKCAVHFLAFQPAPFTTGSSGALRFDLEQCGFYVGLEEYIPFSPTGIRQGWVYIFSRVRSYPLVVCRSPEPQASCHT